MSKQVTPEIAQALKNFYKASIQLEMAWETAQNVPNSHIDEVLEQGYPLPESFDTFVSRVGAWIEPILAPATEPVMEPTVNGICSDEMGDFD